MRTASRRARRLGGLLLVAVTVWWAFLRRRGNAITWAEPPASVPPEPGAPGVLPEDVIATDAGLTELPGASEGAGTVDETLVAELLAESPGADVVVVDETVFEEAVADAAPGPAPEAAAGPAPGAVPDAVPDLPAPGPAADEPTDAELAATGPAVAEPGAGEPTVAEPAADEPTDAELAATGPAVAEPAAGVPAVDEPGGAVGDELVGVDEPTETELVGPGVDESGGGSDDEETSTRIPMPTFSEAPTMEIPAVSDNLRAVRGIGPSMERMLHGLGIVSFRQLAMLDGGELERVRAELSDFRSRIEREDWVGQARALHREKYGRDPS